MKGEYVNLTADAKCSEVGDVEGHVLCTFEIPSVGIVDGGERHARIVKGTGDYVKGVGTHQGYTINTFADGSTMSVQWEGSVDFNDQNVRISQGTYNCLAGTGRYANVKCNGTWSSSPQKGGFTLGTYEGTMTLPD